MAASVSQLQVDRSTRSRRALLAGALGGLGALVASAIGRPDPARATDGQAIIQGADNSGTQDMLVRTSTGTAFQGLADATDGTTYGVRGRNSSIDGAGVYGVAGATTGHSYGVYGVTNSTSISAIGVRGDGPTHGVYGGSNLGTGVAGASGAGIGVYGGSSATDQPGTAGQTFGNSTGVLGFSGGGGLTLPTAPAKTGVYGEADQDAGSRGVSGFSSAGHGVHGKTSTGFAGYFEGRVLTTKYHELVEIGTPSAPGKNHARVFIRDNGSGKTQLCVKFANGSLKVLATQS